MSFSLQKSCISFFRKIKKPITAESKKLLLTQLSKIDHKAYSQVLDLLHIYFRDANYYCTKLPSKEEGTKVKTSLSELLDIEISNGDVHYSFYRLCFLLSNRTLSGDAAKAAIYQFFEQDMSPATSDIYEKVLLRKSIGITSSFADKHIFPASKFKCLLADNAQMDRDKIDYPNFIFTEKI